MDQKYFGELSIIGMKGCDEFLSKVDGYLRSFRDEQDRATYLVNAECPRFGSGEGKGMLHESLRGHDLYIICDMFNHGVTYKMYGQTVPMSPDDHYMDLMFLLLALIKI